MPALEIPAQLLIEHAGSDLQQMLRSRWGPPHLSFLHKPLADNLADRGLDEAGRNGLAVPARETKQFAAVVAVCGSHSRRAGVHAGAHVCGDAGVGVPD